MKAAVLALCLLAIACGSRDEGRGDSPGSQPLAAVALPELSRVDPPVQAQIREKYEAVTTLLASGVAEGPELATAFGEYGMVLHAAEYFDAAEPAYLNAQRLAPDEVRWPYYLAHVHRTEGHIAPAVAAFRRVLDLRPDDAPALVWLGRMLLDQGEPEQAEPLFVRAQATAPNLAAQIGLGQAALARKDYAAAVQRLEAALALDPRAGSVYAPLAMAYRGLGQADKAESLAERWSNTEVAVPDPLRAELDVSLRSALGFELRGVRALDAGDFAAAAELFREGLLLAPEGSLLSRSLRHKLGTALALGGNTAGAVEQFEETIRLAPTGPDEAAAKASYSLGVLLASMGRTPQAVDRLTAALRYNPNYLEARLALGDVLRTAGRPAAALPHYAEAVRLDPRGVQARVAYAMALVRLRRDAEARAWLEEAMRAQPDRAEIAQALARVLAAAPDAGVRDGRRALAIAEGLMQASPTTDTGETLAMALAEVGAFSDAVAVQREMLEAARQAGRAVDAARMAANLRLYERGRPARTPWPGEAAEAPAAP